MPVPDSQIAAYVRKNTPSIERIERIRAIGMTFDDDAEAARDMAFVVEFYSVLRRMQDKATEPKWGGMDRVGI